MSACVFRSVFIVLHKLGYFAKTNLKSIKAHGEANQSGLTCWKEVRHVKQLHRLLVSLCVVILYCHLCHNRHAPLESQHMQALEVRAVVYMRKEDLELPVLASFHERQPKQTRVQVTHWKSFFSGVCDHFVIRLLFGLVQLQLLIV